MKLATELTTFVTWPTWSTTVRKQVLKPLEQPKPQPVRNFICEHSDVHAGTTPPSTAMGFMP